MIIEPSVQFATLESFIPRYNWFKIRRALGTDGLTARALRRNSTQKDQFPEDIAQLQQYFKTIRVAQFIQRLVRERMCPCEF